MCHLVLLLPLITLPIFWLVPLRFALILYGVVLLISIWTYWYLVQSMRRPIVAGREELLHAIGRVLRARGRSLEVRVHSEIWSAISPDRLRAGDEVEVTGIDGLKLRVHRHAVATSAPASGETPAPGTKSQHRGAARPGRDL